MATGPSYATEGRPFVEQAVATIRPPRVGEMGHVRTDRCYAAVIVAATSWDLRVNYFLPENALVPYGVSHRWDPSGAIGWHRIEDCQWQQ